MTGRCFSAGRLYKVRHGNGPQRWTLDYRSASGARRRVALSTDRSAAERMRIDLIRERDLEMAGLGSIENQSRPLADIAKLFLDDLRTRATATHFRNVRSRLAHFLARVPAQRVRDLAPHHVLAYRAQRLADGVSRETANHTVRAAKSMLNWAVECGLIVQNPIARVKKLVVGEKYTRRRRRALTEDEVARFLAAAAEDDALMQDDRRASTVHGQGSGGPRSMRAARIPQAPMWKAFIEGGARYAELVNTTWDDLDLVERTLRLRGETTKSGKTRLVPLREPLVRELVALREVHQRVFGKAGPRVFLTPRGIPWSDVSRNALRVFFRVLKRARIARRDEQGRVVDIHALRKTCATRLLRRGAPLTTVKQLLGHATIEMTARHYADVDLADVRAAIGLLEPKKHTADSHVA